MSAQLRKDIETLIAHAGGDAGLDAIEPGLADRIFQGLDAVDGEILRITRAMNVMYMPNKQVCEECDGAGVINPDAEIGESYIECSYCGGEGEI